jgi:type II secretory pathway pseudopilin PulG
MIVLMIMLLLGLALFATVNAQTSQTRYERAGEAAFDLAESALQAEAYQLQVAWPSAASAALPTPCNQLAAQQVGCEGVGLMSRLPPSYAGPEYARATWSAQVLDDPPGLGGDYYYSDALLTSSQAPAWDLNNDGRMWVRAQATVGGQTRTLVEQMVHQHSTLPLPDNTVTAGGIFSENLGNKVMIEAYDTTTGLVGNVEVRCGDKTTQPSYGQGNCLGWSSDKGQLSPPTSYGGGYQDPSSGQQIYKTLTTAQINEVIATAQANGTYYPQPGATCPPDGTAGVVVVANGSVCPAYTGNATWNASNSPGALVVLQGSLSMSGNETFYGVIYMANQGGAVPPCTSTQLDAPPILTIDGNAQLFGAAFVDGCGVVAVGESGSSNNTPGNINFSANGLNGLYAADAAAAAQNTFRIIPNN